MKITVFDKSINKKAVFFTFLSLYCEDPYNYVGKFVIEFQSADNIKGKIDTGDFIEIEGVRQIQVATSISFDKNKFTVSGYSAAFILSKRIAIKDVNQGNAETAMLNLISGMTVIKGLSAASPSGLTDEFSGTAKRGSILSMIDTIAISADIGYRIIRQGNQLLFECYKPGINSYGNFSSALSNMLSEKYDKSIADHFNYAKVIGTLLNGTEIIEEIGDTSLSPEDKREKLYDYSQQMQQESETETQYRNSIKFQAWGDFAKRYISELSSLEILSNHVNVGDIVKIRSSYFDTTANVRITKTILKSQRNELKKSIEIGFPIR